MNHLFHRPMSRRQQFDDERDPPAGNGGMVIEAEKLLHANCDPRPLVGRVIDGYR